MAAQQAVLAVSNRSRPLASRRNIVTGEFAVGIAVSNRSRPLASRRTIGKSFPLPTSLVSNRSRPLASRRFATLLDAITFYESFQSIASPSE